MNPVLQAEETARSVVSGMAFDFIRPEDTVVFYIGCFGILMERTWYSPRG